MKGKESKANKVLPEIPGKVYFAIGEVSRLCDLQPHVLRYWEQEFKQIEPSKRRGNRRYYQRKDVEVIRHIRELLYVKGYTIDGARQFLQTEVKQKRSNPLKRPINDAITSLERIVRQLELPMRTA